jgi:betaine-aldehyde dehydrogenase
MIVRDSLYIGGNHEKPASSAVFDVISPFTEQVIARVPEASPAGVDRAVAAARQAFDHGPWPRTTPDERADVLDRLLASLQKRSTDIASTTLAR